MANLCRTLERELAAAKKSFDHSAEANKAWLAELDRLKACEKELAEALILKNEDPRMLREQIRVADVAFQGLHERHQNLQTDIKPLLAAKWNSYDASVRDEFLIKHPEFKESP